MKKHIPNIITLSNLTCGILAIQFAMEHDPLSLTSTNTLWIASLFVLLGLFFDFFDGFFARILAVSGEMGKQLDSLADMVTFGVAPGLIMYKLLFVQYQSGFKFDGPTFYDDYGAYIAFIIPLLSAVRLAKFNISTNQSDQFIGLPTPANAIFFVSIPLVFEFGELNFIQIKNIITILPFLIVLFSLLLNANIPLIALKFKTFGWNGNEVRFIFLAVSIVVILCALLINNIFIATPIIILLYLIISILNNFIKSKK